MCCRFSGFVEASFVNSYQLKFSANIADLVLVFITLRNRKVYMNAKTATHRLAELYRKTPTTWLIASVTASLIITIWLLPKLKKYAMRGMLLDPQLGTYSATEAFANGKGIEWAFYFHTDLSAAIVTITLVMVSTTITMAAAQYQTPTSSRTPAEPKHHADD